MHPNENAHNHIIRHAFHGISTIIINQFLIYSISSAKKKWFHKSNLYILVEHLID